MNVKIIGVIILLIIVIIGIIFSLGLGEESKPGNTPQSIQTSLSAAQTPQPTQTAAAEAAQGPVSVEIRSCTNTTAGGFEVDLHMKNKGSDIRILTVYPMGDIIELQPLQNKTKDLAIPFEKGTLTIVVDDGEKFELPVPACVMRGGSGGSVGFLAAQGASNPETIPATTTPAPTEPVPTTGPATSPTATTPGITPTVIPVITTPTPNSIPEFQWIGLPVVTVMLLVLFFRRK